MPCSAYTYRRRHTCARDQSSCCGSWRCARPRPTTVRTCTTSCRSTTRCIDRPTTQRKRCRSPRPDTRCSGKSVPSHSVRSGRRTTPAPRAGPETAALGWSWVARTSQAAVWRRCRVMWWWSRRPGLVVVDDAAVDSGNPVATACWPANRWHACRQTGSGFNRGTTVQPDHPLARFCVYWRCAVATPLFVHTLPDRTHARTHTRCGWARCCYRESVLRRSQSQSQTQRIDRLDRNPGISHAVGASYSAVSGESTGRQPAGRRRQGLCKRARRLERLSGHRTAPRIAG